MRAKSSVSVSSLICSNCREMANSEFRSDEVFNMPMIRWPVRTLLVAEHQRGVDPATLDRVLDVRGKIGDRRRAARQPIEGIGHVLGQARRIDLEMPDDAMQVGVVVLQNLLNPVHQLHVRIAPQLAENGRPLDSLVGEAIELAEQRGAVDLAHATLALT